MTQVQSSYGLHESLAHLHQLRKVELVAVIADPSGRCLMIDGGLPQEPHVCLGVQKCALPFADQIVRSVSGLSRSRVHGTARAYDHVVEGLAKTTYIVVRIDTQGSTPVPGGEWVASAERAVAVAKGDLIPLRCIQQHFGSQLTWQLPSEQLS